MFLNKKIPNFILVGTAKAGTSFLLKYLTQHPDLFIPNTNQLHFHSKLKNLPSEIKKNKLKTGIFLGLSAYWGLILVGTLVTFN